ncbi:MAG: porin [Pseudomonadota bacterium]
MNKTVIALALLAGHAGLAAAQSSVTVFGMVDNFVELGNNGKATLNRLQSGGIYGSRIGFRGTEELGGGTKALFHLESGINADDGSLGQGGLLFGRQAFVGLSGNYGMLTMGRQYSPTFTTMATYGMGGGMGWGNASVDFTDLAILRVNNSINYVTPAFAGVTLKGFYALGENATPGQSHTGNMAGGSAQYDLGEFSASLSYLERKTSTSNSDQWWTAGGAYNFGVVKTGVVVQKRKDDAKLAGTTFYELSATVPTASGSLLLDFGSYRNDIAANADARFYAIRYDHYLSKRTTAYAGYAKTKNQASAAITINGAASGGMAVAKGDDPRALALGIRHIF